MSTQPEMVLPNLVAAFIDAAVSDLRRAEEILIQHPAIADAGFHVALVLGNAKEVERRLTRAAEAHGIGRRSSTSVSLATPTPTRAARLV